MSCPDKPSQDNLIFDIVFNIEKFKLHKFHKMVFRILCLFLCLHLNINHLAVIKSYYYVIRCSEGVLSFVLFSHRGLLFDSCKYIFFSTFMSISREKLMKSNFLKAIKRRKNLGFEVFRDETKDKKCSTF